MLRKVLLFTVSAGSLAFGQWGGSAQTRRAEIRGGGGDGKCTIEVEVDDVAEVEIRGDSARLRTLAGSPANWRRFVCNQTMPLRPYDFRFQGIDGRGRQELVRDPNNGGAAVIRISDSKGGREGYTFDVKWRGGSGVAGSGGDRDRWGNSGDGWGNNGSRRNDDRRDGGGAWGNRSGWSGNRGDTFQFRGDGRGTFDRRNGRDLRVRDVDVSLSRDGRVALSFEAQGSGRLNFRGTADRYDRDRINAVLDGGGMRGNATIYLDNRGEVQRIDMQGNGRGDDFRLNWSAR